MMTVSNINIHSAKGKKMGVRKKRQKKRGKMRERGRRKK